MDSAISFIVFSLYLILFFRKSITKFEQNIQFCKNYHFLKNYLIFLFSATFLSLYVRE